MSQGSKETFARTSRKSSCECGVSGMARVRLADLNGPKWTSLGQNGLKWTILVHFGLAIVKIRFRIRSFSAAAGRAPNWTGRVLNSSYCSGKGKRAQRLTLWVLRPPGGVGVFRAKGWWLKSSCSPLKVCVLWVSKRGIWDVPGNFAGMSRTPGGVQKVCAKKVRAHFSFSKEALSDAKFAVKSARKFALTLCKVTGQSESLSLERYENRLFCELVRQGDSRCGPPGHLICQKLSALKNRNLLRLGLRLSTRPAQTISASPNVSHKRVFTLIC